MCHSGRRMSRRQRRLQQQCEARGRNSRALVTDRGRSRPWPQKTRARPQIPRLPEAAAELGLSLPPNSNGTKRSPSPALYIPLYLTVEEPGSSYRLGGKRDQKKAGLSPDYLRTRGGKPEPAAWCPATPTTAGQGKKWDAPTLPSRPYEETERKHDVWAGVGHHFTGSKHVPVSRL